jgi:hypothetical protein
MVIAGAVETVTHQAFDVQIAKLDEEGGRALVFLKPNGTAHVFGLNDEGRRKVLAELSGVETATVADITHLRDNGGR